MSFTSFAAVYAISAGAMAVWIDVRFPNLAPVGLRAALIRLAAGFVLVHLTLPVASDVLNPLPPITEAATALVIGFLLLTGIFLATFWMVKIAQGMLGGAIR